MNFEYENLNSLFFGQVERFGSKGAYRFKRDGTWKEVTWKEYGTIARDVALGLLALGKQKDEVLAVMCTCRPEWDILDRANLACGGITVGVYETNPAEQTRYILDHAEATVVAVENSDQLKKLEKVLDRLPRIQYIIIVDVPPSGIPSTGKVRTLAELIEKGRSGSREFSGELTRRVAATRPDDVAAYVYTSGTTGPPKGAIITHKNLLASGYVLAQCMGVRFDDIRLDFLPFSHVLQRTAVLTSICSGFQRYYAESVPKLLDNLPEVRPTLFGSVPRMFEKAYAKIMENVAKSPPFRQKIFHSCLDIGLRYSRYLQAGRPIPLTDRILYGIAKKLVFSKVAEVFGGRVRLCLTGSAPIAIEVLEFFQALGMLTLEGYALTETCTLGTFNRVDAYKFGTVGKVVPGMEIRIAADGEICLKGIGLFKGYLKDPEKTKEAVDEEGWYHTGDLGSIDAEGFVTITGRKKDLIITAGGKNVAPSNIENLLKSCPYVSQAMVYGDRKPYLTALITLNVDEMETFCKEKGISSRATRELARHPEIVRKIQEVVNEKNQELARFEQIKKFIILERDLLLEENEITPTMKVKRNVVTDRFRALLEALYSEPSGRID